MPKAKDLFNEVVRLNELPKDELVANNVEKAAELNQIRYPKQTFAVELLFVTEHGKQITAIEFTKWLAERFEGCDLCGVKLASLKEI